MNRGEQIEVSLIVQPPASVASPAMQVACLHEGVRVRERPIRPMVWGVDRRTAALTGLGLAIAVAIGMSWSNVAVGWVAAVVLLVAAIAQNVGAAAIRLWRGVIQLLS